MALIRFRLWLHRLIRLWLHHLIPPLASSQIPPLASSQIPPSSLSLERPAPAGRSLFLLFPSFHFPKELALSHLWLPIALCFSLPLTPENL